MKTRKFARFCSISPLPRGADEPEGVPPLPFHKTPQDAAHRVPGNADGMGKGKGDKNMTDRRAKEMDLSAPRKWGFYGRQPPNLKSCLIA